MLMHRAVRIMLFYLQCVLDIHIKIVLDCLKRIHRDGSCMFDMALHKGKLVGVFDK